MNKIEQPIQSTQSLVKAAVASTLLAVVILVTAVLPAEYGIDPTGLGDKMGLMALAAPAESAVKPVVASCDDGTSMQEGSVDIMVPAQSGLEYKLHIEKGETLAYSWVTDGAALYFDFHGEPEGDTTGYFKSFKEATLNNDSGSLVVPFTGSHGWYWKNETNAPVKVSLRTKGIYQVIGLR